MFDEPIPPVEKETAEPGFELSFRATAEVPASVFEPTARARLVDSAAGHIDVLLLTVPSNLHDLTSDHFHSLIESFGPGTTYVLLHNEEQWSAVARWKPAGIAEERWRQIATPFDLVLWAQDPYAAMALDGPGGEISILLEGVQFNASGMVVADEVVAGLALLGSPAVQACQSFLFFEGGNLLATSNRVLIGKDHLSRNLGRPGLADADRVSQRFGMTFGDRRRLLPIGTKGMIRPEDHWGHPLTGWYQPIFHIDMHVTPTGVLDEGGREILLYGTPAEVDRRDVPGGFRLQASFDEIEELLAQEFTLIRLPLLPVLGDGGQGWPEESYYLTWNNVLIESFDNSEGGVSRNVFMPVYDHHLDDRAEEIWRDAGFEVHRLSNMQDLAYAGGAAHCITKTLRRGSPPPRG